MPLTYPDDEAGIRRAALDYAEGWYTADAERMARCLHSGLAKRTLRRDAQTGAERLVHLTREVMVNATAQGGGANPAAECQVAILDVFAETACARVDSPEYVDYLHLAKSDGRWQIINVLWANRA
jgi:hypothetical protein